MAGDPRNSDLMRPQSPEVYRRRRIVALALLVLVLALLVGLGSRILPSRRQPIVWTPRQHSTSDEHRIIWLEAERRLKDRRSSR